MKLSSYAKAVLLKAEKIIDARKSKRTLGTEIDETRLELFDEKTKASFRELYNRTKRNNPEIWERDLHDLPSSAYYDNEEFWGLLDYIDEVNFIASCYPDRKEEVKALRELKTVAPEISFVNLFYEKLKFILRTRDEVPPFSKMMKYINDIKKCCDENVEILPDGVTYWHCRSKLGGLCPKAWEVKF